MSEDTQETTLPVDEDALHRHLLGTSPGFTNSVDVARRVLEGKEQMEVVFKREVEVPVRQETPPRAHIFYNLEDMLQYLGDNVGQNPVALICPHQEGYKWSISVVLDESARMGLENVRYEPRLHPLVKPWINFTMEVTEFHRFLIQNKSVIRQPAAKELITAFRQIKIAKSISIASGSGTGAVEGMMCETVIGGQSQEVPVPLPEIISIECPFFLDGDDQTFELDCLLSEKGGKAYIELIFPENMAWCMKMDQTAAIIAERMPAMQSGIGSVNHSYWTYLERGAE